MIHISRISLRNFKSFRRVTLPIPKGFTAIVGPNGSGKSNIVDGICFVLGRSSAKSLRAERFSDLIFNGGKKEKPATDAEVTLYLDNSGRELPTEEKEVKISRSIDVEGNSIYRLNGKRSTRNEILDLIAHAKIYPDGHNIVLQGDVTGLIEMSPIERRGLIDEIAGIAEYDEKKRKALRELEKVGENISKVEAVLGEVGVNLSKLTKEREDALRHIELKGEVRRSKGMVLHSHRLESEGRIKALQEALSRSDEELGRIDKFLNVLALKHEVKRQELEKVNLEIAAGEESDRFQSFKELELAKNELSALDAKQKELRERLAAVEDEYIGSKKGLVEVHVEIKKCGTENISFAGEIRKLEDRLSELRTKIKAIYIDASEGGDAAEIREKLRVVREAFDGKQREFLEAQRQESEATVRLQAKDTHVQALNDEIKDRKAKLDSMNGDHKTLSKRASEIEDALKKLAADKANDADALQEARREIGKIDAALEVKLREQAKLRAKCQAMEDIGKRGFERAVEEVLNLRDKGKKGIYGTLSELGKVDQRFSKALAAAAGRGLEFIVVEDVDVAEECIKHLKEAKSGRATFLPLSKLKEQKPNDRQMALAARCHGFAVNLVSFEPKFKTAFAYLFRNTIVVDDIQAAKNLGIGEARMVTLDGDLVEQAGAMSGGFFRHVAGGFEEMNESMARLEKMNREISDVEAKKEKLQKKDAELRASMERRDADALEMEKEKGMLSGRISSLADQVKEMVNTIAALEVKSKEESAAVRDLKKSLADYMSISKKLSKEFEAFSKEKSSLESQLEGSGEEGAFKVVRAIEEEVLSVEKEKEAKRGAIALNDSRVSDILRPKFDALKKRLVEAHAARKRMREDISKSEISMFELSEKVAVLEKRVEDVSKGLDELRGRRESLAKAVSAIDRRRDELKEKSLEVRRGMEDVRVEKARREAKLEDVIKALGDFEDMKIELTAPIDTMKLEKDIARMEAEMQALEPINMRAVEDYEGVREKHEALNAKIAKLLEEKEAILRLMEEIERRKMSVFMEVFENIAMNFSHLFNKLSNGGTADLILDEVNPLEGGLQIRAKPVGKNPQYIELMSGGEKTLTALSVIFAIQRYQPAPFYIMDEVDMFLDDENIRRISDMVQESSRGAQFIVVSLRDSLMSSADQLFGMSNEDGISKIIGVELQEVGNTEPESGNASG